MNLKDYCEVCHGIASEKGFWDVDKSTPTKLMLIVTELGEACEADRNSDDDNFREEIADTFIRLFDLCGYLDIDIEKEIQTKMSRNMDRPRLHGKKY